MNSPLLSIKVSFWWCMMFTLPTRIFSSFTYWTFLVIYTHIAQKDIPSIYELTLCADLDFLLSLLDTHIAHKKKFSHSWSDPLCLSRLTFVVDWYSHCPQGYFILSWSGLLCPYRLPFGFAWYSHYPQGQFLHELTFCAWNHFIPRNFLFDRIPINDFQEINLFERKFRQRFFPFDIVRQLTFWMLTSCGTAQKLLQTQGCTDTRKLITTSNLL